MHAKIACFGACLLLPFFLVPAFSADADAIAGTRKPAASRPDTGRLLIVNLTQGQIVRTHFGDAPPVDLAHPIGPGASVWIDPAVASKACGDTTVVISFDDDTEAAGAINLCIVKKLTLHDIAPEQ